MKEGKNLTEDFRLWYREQFRQFVGEDPDNTDYFLFPMKDLQNIIIEETHSCLVSISHPSPQKTTAEILEIDRKTVQRALK